MALFVALQFFTMAALSVLFIVGICACALVGAVVIGYFLVGLIQWK